MSPSFFLGKLLRWTIEIVFFPIELHFSMRWSYPARLHHEDQICIHLSRGLLRADASANQMADLVKSNQKSLNCNVFLNYLEKNTEIRRCIFFLKAIGHYFIVFSSEYVFSSQNVQSNIHTDGMSIHSISKFSRLGGISQNMYINNHI